MKRMNLILIFSLFSACLSAPPYPVVYIPISEELNEYTPLIRAVVKVESNNGKYLFNEKENAIGYFQIRECRIKDFNKRTGKNYLHSDMYDYDKSKEVFLYYCQGRSYEQVARAWCSGEAGTKKASQNYYLKIQKELLSL